MCCIHIPTPTTRVCAIHRTPLGCYENLIRSDLFIHSSRRSVPVLSVIKIADAILPCSKKTRRYCKQIPLPYLLREVEKSDARVKLGRHK